jgi:hypothetical protein
LGFYSNQVERNVDIAVRGLRIGAELLGVFTRGWATHPLQTRQVYIETGAQGTLAGREMQIEFRVDGEFGQRG